MGVPRIVVDTNVLVAGLKSRRGASFKLLSLLGDPRFEIAISVALFLEYEDVLTRQNIGISVEQMRDVLNYISRVSIHQEIFFYWRPCLKDPQDDLVLEVAVASQSGVIVTFNGSDFVGVENFGIRALTPANFLAEIGAIP